jgi:hypothetical protein
MRRCKDWKREEFEVSEGKRETEMGMRLRFIKELGVVVESHLVHLSLVVSDDGAVFRRLRESRGGRSLQVAVDTVTEKLAPYEALLVVHPGSSVK